MPHAGRENMDFTHGMNMDANCQQDEYTSLEVMAIFPSNASFEYRVSSMVYFSFGLYF
ncbi:unnamed protein product [Camellia sinensis]|uniref:Uncharacterized protein n=1 Tax=Camellia sinensis TaxID=4442 RepID=A0A7J7H806_CAMSI|nr:hypothetical protein HYC85_015017 [Camellia sinensis]